MKKIVCVIVAIVCGVCVANAGEAQEIFCGDKSLSYCIKYYDKQCEAKNYGACFALGTLHFEQEQYGESKKYFEMTCDKENSKAVYQVELIDGSLGQKVSATEIIKLSCRYIANHYYNGLGVRQDFTKALQYHNKACDWGNSDSCVSAGFAYKDGEGTKKDLNYAIKLFAKSCELESAVGCFGLGVMYRYGDGAVQNLSKAKELYGKACDLGEQMGCDYYKELNEMGVK